MRRSRLVREQVELLAAQGREQPLFRDYIPNGVGAFLGQVCIPLEKHTAMFPAVDSGDVQALVACVDHGVDRFA